MIIMLCNAIAETYDHTDLAEKCVCVGGGGGEAACMSANADFLERSAYQSDMLKKNCMVLSPKQGKGTSCLETSVREMLFLS